MANIENLKAFDPFADAAKGDDESVQDGLVHVRIQQRNGRKTLTTVQVRSRLLRESGGCQGHRSTVRAGQDVECYRRACPTSTT